MKSTGIVRRVDVLGRVVIPKELRKMLKIAEGDPLEIYVERDEIILKKYSPLFNSDGVADEIANCLATRTGHTVFVCDRDVFISGHGAGIEDVTSKNVSKELSDLMLKKGERIINHVDGGAPFELTDGETYGYYNEFFIPVKTKSEVIGGIILAEKDKEQLISSTDVSLTSLSADLLAARF